MNTSSSTRIPSEDHEASALPVRRLSVDWPAALPRQWLGGDAFLSALYGALSMSFPAGEQFFIDSVRDSAAQLPPDQREEFEPMLRGFIGQEATHRHLHKQFNDRLAALGYVNTWEGRITARQALLKNQDDRHALAITAGNEHFTALLAQYMLEHPELLAGTDASIARFWLWHAAEEFEHRGVAMDLYALRGGSEVWRKRWMRRVTLLLISDAMRQTVSILRHDKQLWKWSTWRSAARFFFGKQGLVRSTWADWKAYFRPGFSPMQQVHPHSGQWLAANGAHYRVIGGPTAVQTPA